MINLTVSRMSKKIVIDKKSEENKINKQNKMKTNCAHDMKIVICFVDSTYIFYFNEF